MKLSGTQVYMLVVLALALVAIVLLATLTDGAHIVTVIAFLTGWAMPSPKSGGGSGGPGGSARRTGTIAGAALVAVVLGVSGMLAGCGGPIQAQSQAIRGAALGLDVASDLAETWATADLAACEDVPCVDAVEARWAPVAAGQASVLAALATWSAGLSLYMATASEAVARWMVRAAQDVITAWQAMDAAAAALGHDLPDVPPVVLSLVGSLAGEP